MVRLSMRILLINEQDTYVFDVSDSSMAGVDLKIAQVSDDTPLDSTITASGTAGESEATVSITLPDGQSGTDPDLYFYLEKDGQAYAGEDFEASIKLEDGLL